MSVGGDESDLTDGFRGGGDGESPGETGGCDGKARYEEVVDGEVGRGACIWLNVVICGGI